MRWALPAAAAFCACSPDPIVLVDARPARTYAIIQTGVTPHPDVRVVSVDHDLSTPLEVERIGDSAVYVLGYADDVAALRLLPDASGMLSTSADRSGWPLPLPDLWWSLARGQHEIIAGVGDALATTLAGFSVARPPCAETPRAIPVRGLPPGGHITGALRLGDDVVFIVDADEVAGVRVGTRIHRASVEEGVIGELTGDIISTSTIAVRMESSLTFTDGEQGYIAWPGTATTAGTERIDLYPLLDSGRLGAPTTTYLSAPSRPIQLNRIAALGSTVVAIDEDGNLFALDEGTRRWREVAALGRDQESCSNGIVDLLLTVDGPGTGWVSGQGQPVQRYDLSAPGVLTRARLDPEMSGSCRAARTVTQGGLEVLSFEPEGVKDDTVVRMRRPGGPWLTVPIELKVNAKAMTAVDDEIILSGTGESLVMLDDEPSRPELLARECGTVMNGVDTHLIVDLGRRRMFIGGYGRIRGLFVELAPRP